MDSCEHKSILLDSLSDFLNKIDMIPCHPKNKLLLYHRYILCKLSWHLTIADLSKAWVVENLDSVVTRYIRKWFQLPISASISGLIVSRSEGRYTWRHNSVLHFIASTLKGIKDTSLFVDRPSILSPCINTGEQGRPDMLLSAANYILYIIELTVGFETNIDNSASRKYEKYRSLKHELSSCYHEVKFMSLSVRLVPLGILVMHISKCTMILTLIKSMSNISLRS